MYMKGQSLGICGYNNVKKKPLKTEQIFKTFNEITNKYIADNQNQKLKKEKL